MARHSTKILKQTNFCPAFSKKILRVYRLPHSPTAACVLAVSAGLGGGAYRRGSVGAPARLAWLGGLFVCYMVSIGLFVVLLGVLLFFWFCCFVCWLVFFVAIVIDG